VYHITVSNSCIIGICTHGYLKVSYNIQNLGPKSIIIETRLRVNYTIFRFNMAMVVTLLGSVYMAPYRIILIYY